MEHLQTKNSDPQQYLVNYKESMIKDMGFLSYINNADLIADVTNFDDAFFKKYLTYGSILNNPIPSLLYLHANLIMLHLTKNTVFVVNDQLYDTLLQDEEIVSIIETHIEMISHLPMYVMSNTLKDYSGESDEPCNFNDIGLSWINLLKIPHFIDICIQHLLQNNLIDFNKKYPKNFNDYIFKGKNLSAYINQDSLWFVTIQLQAQNDVS